MSSALEKSSNKCAKELLRQAQQCCATIPYKFLRIGFGSTRKKNEEKSEFGYVSEMGLGLSVFMKTHLSSRCRVPRYRRDWQISMLVRELGLARMK